MSLRARFTCDADGQRYFGDGGGAGCVVLAQSTGRLLLSKRSENVEEPHTWGTWGGAIEPGSSPRRTAVDELFEETGYDGPLKLEPLCVFRSPGGGFLYHNHLAIVPDEFTPWDSRETEEARWVDVGDWPEPLHFGLRHLIGDVASMKHVMYRVAQVKAGADFVTDAPLPERTLYHCLYQTPQGDALEPRNMFNSGQGEKLLFATHYMTKALAFAFSYHSSLEGVCNGGIEGTPDEYIIVCNRDDTMRAPRPARVYAFSSYNFEPFGDARKSQQWVSRAPVKFSDARLCFEGTAPRHLMQQGLQIFSYAGSAAALCGIDDKGGLLQAYWDKARSNVDVLARMTGDGLLRWENRARGLYRNAALDEAVPKASKKGVHP